MATPTSCKYLKYSITLIGLINLSPFSYAQTQVGQVILASGEVAGQQPGAAKRDLSRRSPVFEKDTITTGSSGSVQIRFNDNSIVSLKPGSNYSIDAYQYNKTGTTPSKEYATLQSGGASTLTGEIKKQDAHDVQITTKVAIVGLRGTEVETDYVEGNKLKVEVNNGVVEIRNKSGIFMIGTGYRSATSVLISSDISSPVSLTQGHVISAFNVEGIRNNDYLEDITLNEELGLEEVEEIEHQIAVDCYLTGYPPGI